MHLGHWLFFFGGGDFPISRSFVCLLTTKNIRPKMSPQTKHSEIKSISHPCFRRSSRKPAFLSFLVSQSSSSSRSLFSLLVSLAFVFQGVNYKRTNQLSNLPNIARSWPPSPQRVVATRLVFFPLQAEKDIRCWMLDVIWKMMVFILLFEMWLLAIHTKSSGSIKLKDIVSIRIS